MARDRATARELGAAAPVFAALGDETRLRLVARLGAGGPTSIARLTEGTGVTRQAISKHLGVLERAGLVRRRRSGRESVYELHPSELDRARRALELVARHWDAALDRLAAMVEEDERDDDGRTR